MRADLIRYLALLQDGGVYNDVDVGCLKPIDLWIPPAFRHNTSVVLGIEVDNEMGPDRSKLFELVNWTIMSRRNAPFMRYLVDRVIENLENNAAKHNTTLSSLQPKRQEVIDVTGPAALTQAAFQYLSEKTQTTVDMQNFTKMRRPKLVADILVLPINAFGAGHQVQWSGTDEDGSALVHHYFAGSWKTNHFDGPTEEEKKAAEEKKKEEDRKKKEEEDKKIKEESEKKKAEEERRKKEEDEKRKAELEQKSREEAEANKQKVTIENQSSEQGHKDGQGQVQQEQQSDQEPQEGEDQQSGVEQQDGQEQENGDEHEAGEEEQQNTKPAGQPGPDPHAGQTQGKEAKAESSKEEEKLSISVVQQERQRAIEELDRVNAVRRKTREEAIKKIVADRKKDVEERKKDEENKKKLAELEERKSKQQAPVANTQTAADQGQAQSASKEQAQSNAPAQQHASKP